MRTPLEESMSRATDEQLYEILNLNRAEYSSEAITVAESELRKRSLELGRVQELEDSIERKRARATEPLSWPMKLLLFYCGATCLGIPVLIIAVVTEVAFQEADRKQREAWRWLGYGILVPVVAAFGCFVVIAVRILAARIVDYH
jgi:hypothetical protein